MDAMTERPPAAATSGYEQLAGRRIAVVETTLHTSSAEAVRRAKDLGAELRLLVGDRDGYGGPGRWSDHPLTRLASIELVDTSDPDAVARHLTGADGSPTVDAVLSFSDDHVQVAAQVAERCRLPGAESQAFHLTDDRFLMRRQLAHLPSAVPHRLVRGLREAVEAARDLGYPVVLKPPQEVISHGARLVPSAAGLVDAYQEVAAFRRSLRGQPRAGHVLVEAYVPGSEVSVETLTVDGTTHLYGFTSKALRPPPTFLARAHSFPVELPTSQQQEVLDTVTAALDGIGYRQGPAHTAVKLTPHGVRLIDINPRLASHHIADLVTPVCGRDQHLDAMLLACGLAPPAFPVVHRGGAASVVLYPPGRGRLHRVNLPPDLHVRTDVVVDVHARPGDLVGGGAHAGEGIGVVVARAGTAGAALAVAEDAAARVVVTVGEVP